MKNLFILLAAGIFLVSCNQQSSGKKDQASGKQEMYTVDNFEANASGLIDKEVKITGTVSHTCKHGGKRLFLTGTNPDVTVKVESGQITGGFKEEIIGSDVVVTGIVRETRVDAKYLNEWEMELAAGDSDDKKIHEGEAGEHHATGEAVVDTAAVNSELQQINDMRKQLTDTGKDHLSFYHVECIAFEVTPAEEEKK